jgi:ribA/ribD-fused uncharacterized protein
MLKTKTIVVGDAKVFLFMDRPIAANTAESKGYGSRSVVMYDNYGFGWLISGKNGTILEDVYGLLSEEVTSVVLQKCREKTVFNSVVESKYDRVFSNFAIAPMVVDGIAYSTVEHAYQAMKTTNHNERIMMSMERSPGKVKKEGRKLRLRTGWDGVKLKIMTALVYLKFNANESYKSLLVETGNSEIIEDASGWDDSIWGIGKDGRGNNLLGTALMIARRMFNENIVPGKDWFKVLDRGPEIENPLPF